MKDDPEKPIRILMRIGLVRARMMLCKQYILAYDIHEKTELAVNGSDHEREDFQQLRTDRITKMAYGGAPYLALKKEAMKIWTDAVLDEYERQKNENESMAS